MGQNTANTFEISLCKTIREHIRKKECLLSAISNDSVFVRMHLCSYLCVHVFVRASFCMCRCLCVEVFVCACVCVCMCLYMC